ncbi:MAG: domain containing protein [Labilithrix sp.]|nr:domain containing protein [Labilithrix sp.]
MYLVVPPGGSFHETRRIELGPAPLTIGRAEGCEIRVDIPGVDQEHAKISEVALIALGPDIAIGDVPLDQGSRRLLMPGDEIQIGSVVVVLEGDDPSVDLGSGRNTKALVVPRVRVVEGTNFGDELVLETENREYTIGRGATCDLVIEDREVSREHIKLLRRGLSVFVQDLSSTRGSWLGRSAVYTGSTIEWSRPRMLRVGVTVLSLEVPEAFRRAAPLAQPSAPMTPPPRSRGQLPQPTPSAPAVSSHDTAPGTPESLGEAGRGAQPRGNGAPPGAGATAKMGGFTYEAQPASGSGGSLPAPVVYTPKAMPAPLSRPDPEVVRTYGPNAVTNSNSTPHVPPAATSSQPMMMPVSPAPTRAQRKAWKKSGPVIGRASGLLLLALAGLAILGALFVVFSLLE